MARRDSHPAAGHKQFPYFFTEEPDGTPIEGIWLTEGPAPPPIPWKYSYDMAIFYGSLTNTDFIDCRCSRWDVDNFSIIVETWLKRGDLNTLLANTRPGAVGELYKILGRPRYYDKSWTGKNTLKILPTPSSIHMNTSNLKNMRKETLIYPKNISTHPIKNSKENWTQVKIEGYISGMSDL